MRDTFQVFANKALVHEGHDYLKAFMAFNKVKRASMVRGNMYEGCEVLLTGSLSGDLERWTPDGTYCRAVNLTVRVTAVVPEGTDIETLYVGGDIAVYENGRRLTGDVDIDTEAADWAEASV